MKTLDIDLQDKLKKRIIKINSDRQEWATNNYGANLALDGKTYVLDTSTMKSYLQKNIYAPILKRFFNGVKNIITSNEYKWMLKDSGTSETITEDDKMVAQAVLDEVYSMNKFNVLDDIVVSNMLKYFFSFIYVDYKDNKAEIKVVDTMDVFIDYNQSVTSGIYDGEYVIFFEKTTQENIFNNYNFNFNKGNYKDLYTNIVSDYTEDNYKYMYYFYKNKDTGKIDGIKTVGEYIIEEYKDLDMYPISIIKSQEENYKLYGTSLATLIAPIGDKLQRAYDVISKHLEGYGRRILFQKKGGVLSVRGLSETVAKASNVDGILEFTGTTPETYQPPQIDNSFTYIQQILDSAMQNSVGVHSATLGTVEGRSGIQMAQGQQGDKQNIVDVVQNYKEGIQGLTKILLYLYSNRLNVDLLLEYEGINLRVIGKQEYQFLESIGVDVSGLMPIKYFNKLNVEIVPGDFFTQSYITNKLIELKSAGVPIPDEVLLGSIKVGDVGLLLRKYNLLQKQNAEQDPDIDIATAENKKLGQGNNVEANITDKHKIHIMIHSQLLDQYTQQKENEMMTQLKQQGVDISKEVIQELQQNVAQDKIVKLFKSHIGEHQTMLNGQEQSQANQNLISKL